MSQYTTYTCKHCYRKYEYSDGYDKDYCSVGCKNNEEQEEARLSEEREQEAYARSRQEQKEQDRYEEEQEENRRRYDEEKWHREELLNLEEQKLNDIQSMKANKIKFLCNSAKKGDLNELKASLRDGTDPNGVKEFRPIHYAIAGNQGEIVSYLINTAEVNLNLTNKEGYNAYFYALVHGNQEIINIVSTGNIKLNVDNLLVFVLECIERGRKGILSQIAQRFNLTNSILQDNLKKAYLDKLRKEILFDKEPWQIVISSPLIEIDNEWESDKWEEEKKKKDEEDKRIQQMIITKKYEMETEIEDKIQELEGKLEYVLHKYDKPLLPKKYFEFNVWKPLFLVIAFLPGLILGIYRISIYSGWNRIKEILGLPITILFTTVGSIFLCFAGRYKELLADSAAPYMLGITVIAVGLILFIRISASLYNICIKPINFFREKYNTNLKISGRDIDELRLHIQELRFKKESINNELVMKVLFSAVKWNCKCGCKVINCSICPSCGISQHKGEV